MSRQKPDEPTLASIRRLETESLVDSVSDRIDYKDNTGSDTLSILDNAASQAYQYLEEYGAEPEIRPQVVLSPDQENRETAQTRGFGGFEGGMNIDLSKNTVEVGYDPLRNEIQDRFPEPLILWSNRRSMRLYEGLVEEFYHLRQIEICKDVGAQNPDIGRLEGYAKFGRPDRKKLAEPENKKQMISAYKKFDNQIADSMISTFEELMSIEDNDLEYILNKHFTETVQN